MRINHCITTACSRLVAGAAVALLGASGVPADTIAHWRFEEGVAGGAASGVVLDSSGNGLHGTPLGGLTYSGDTPSATLSQTGDPNGLSMHFDGDRESRVFIADDPLFQLTESFTLEAYVNMSNLPFAGHNAEILFRGDSRLEYDPYVLHIRHGSLVFSMHDGNNNFAGVSTAPPTLNNWTHLAATLDDNTGRMSLYVDGMLMDSTVTSVRPLAELLPGLNPGLSIGGYPATDYFGPFRGMIDEVRISDAALSPDQFLNAAPPVPEPATATLLLIGAGGLALRGRWAASRARC